MRETGKIAPGGMVLHAGENTIDGISVVVTRRRAKHIRAIVKPDGTVALTVPFWRATLAQSAAFLASQWEWVLATRRRVLAHPPPPARAISPADAALLATTAGELHDAWSQRLGEGGVQWKLRRMKTRWGVCNWAKRRITYSLMLAGLPRDLIEYIVVHELTHLKVHGHGPAFHALMDERLPDWRERRKRLRTSG